MQFKPLKPIQLNPHHLHKALQQLHHCQCTGQAGTLRRNVYQSLAAAATAAAAVAAAAAAARMMV